MKRTFSILLLAAALAGFDDARASVPLPLGFFKPLASSSGPSLNNIVVWWKADSLSLSDGTAIGDTGTEWVDQSGNGFTASQSTANRRPLFKINIFGSMPAVEFDGVNDMLQGFGE